MCARCIIVITSRRMSRATLSWRRLWSLETDQNSVVLEWLNLRQSTPPSTTDCIITMATNSNSSNNRRFLLARPKHRRLQSDEAQRPAKIQRYLLLTKKRLLVLFSAYWLVSVIYTVLTVRNKRDFDQRKPSSWEFDCNWRKLTRWVQVETVGNRRHDTRKVFAIAMVKIPWNIHGPHSTTESNCLLRWDIPLIQKFHYNSSTSSWDSSKIW